MKKTGLLLAFLLLLLGGNSFARGPDILDLSSELGLSAEQTQRLEEIRLKAQRKTIKLKADLKLAHLDLRGLLQAEHPDKQAIYKKLDEIGALRTRLERNRIDTRLEIRNLLNPEQRKKLRGRKRQLFRQRKRRRPPRQLPPRPWRPRFAPQPLPPQPPQPK